MHWYFLYDLFFLFFFPAFLVVLFCYYFYSIYLIKSLVQHKGVTCNSCLATDISGNRYKCAICPDFDMCEKCERKGILTHGIIWTYFNSLFILFYFNLSLTFKDITHPRIKMLVPTDCNFQHSCNTDTHNSQGESII